jgi:predicted nucleotidyltransferase
MNHGLSERTISLIRGVLRTFPQVEKAVIYGSRAKGNYKRGSDIDLTLFGGELTDRVQSRIYWALDDLLLPYKIDLSRFSDLRHPALIEHIRRVGLAIYERPAAAA